MAKKKTKTKTKTQKTKAIQFAVKTKSKQALGSLKSWVLKNRKNGLFLGHHLPLKPLERQETSHFKVCDTFCHQLALVRSEVALLLYTLVVQTHFTKLVFQPKQHSESTCRMPDTQKGCIHVLYSYSKVTLSLWAPLGSSSHRVSLQFY